MREQNEAVNQTENVPAAGTPRAAQTPRPARGSAPGWPRRALDTLRRLDPGLIAIILLAAVVAGYLALEGGAYDSIARNRVGILLWWCILAGVVAGALPLRRLPPLAWACLGLLAAFTAWTALSLIWTESVERTSADLGRVVFLTGVFALALFTRSTKAARRMAIAVGTAAAVFAGVALLSRLQPDLFPTATETAEFFSPTRLSFPINYWNGTATLIAIGLPLVLYTTTALRNPLTAALAAAALPMMTLAGYFTYSRGAMIAAFAGIAVFILFSYDRIPRIATLLTASAGSAVLISLASARTELADGLILTQAGRQQGDEMMWIVLAVCATVGAVQAAITLALRKDFKPPWIPIPHRPARIASLTLVVLAFFAALAFNLPGQISDGWEEFKASEPTGAGAERLGSLSGSQRYQLWEVAADQFSSAPVAGTGAGTYEFWHNRLGDGGFVRDAHSLYMETLGELGLVGFLLLLGLTLAVLIGGALGVIRAPGPLRSQLAALLAACVVFVLTAATDWTWELAVLPAAFLLCAAPLITTAARTTGRRRGASSRPLTWPARIPVAAVAVAATVALAIPLASTTLIRESREAAAAGDLELALGKARDAQAILPAAATPYLQEALIYEVAGELDPARQAATEAARNEQTNWRTWLTLARIQAKTGQAEAAIQSYNRARNLNSRSGIFPTPSD